MKPKKILSSDINVMKVNGVSINVGVSKAHFEDINILGMDYLWKRIYKIDGKKGYA